MLFRARKGDDSINNSEIKNGIRRDTREDTSDKH